MQGVSLDTIIKNLPLLGMPLGALLVLGFLRMPYDGTQNHEMNTAVRNAVRTDCSTRASMESRDGDPAQRVQRMQELMDGCNALEVKSIAVRGKLSRPVAKVELEAHKQPVPAGFATRYYALHSRIITWDARRTTALKYHLKVF